MKRLVIIGGGISGLAAAHRLLERSQESGDQVSLTLLEACDRTGGIIQTRERDGFIVESGPDSFISEKPAALELCKRLNLESRLIETNEHNRRSFIVKHGRLLAVPEGFHLLAPSRFWPFFRSDIFSWSGKARMALELAIPRRQSNGTEADESLAQFVRRRFGNEALERMAQPMVGGIYTADPEKLSLRATMPRFLDMERAHGSVIRALRQANGGAPLKQESDTSGARYSLFLSFDRGMQVLTDALKQRIAAHANQGQTSIKLNTTVESLTREPAEAGNDLPLEWKLRTSDHETIVADALCLALPAYASSRLLSELDPQLGAELSEIPYASSTTINLAYQREDIPHPLDGFGFVVPFIEKRSLMACTFSSVKFSGRAPQGQVLLRAFVGGALQPELVELSEAELVSRVRADLRDLLGIERAPLFAEVKKWERSMPQYHVGHLERVKRIEVRLASLPGLVLAGNAYSGLGIPDCIRSGEKAAELIAADN
ncbi:MAG TPA: protoporphyrinogen oxidase [Pyrinomonadaceae bacterium]|jgi:oxygen-dependent protoporphyrinogen oxidase|nr:protoporphyrinogen oxidase [Pyrinomonadaceae bacterium]